MNFTLQNIKDLKELMTSVFDERFDAKFDEKIKDHLQFLPTKDEFYSKMDEVLGEIKAMREEHLIISHKVFKHDAEIEALQSDVSILKKKTR